MISETDRPATRQSQCTEPLPSIFCFALRKACTIARRNHHNHLKRLSGLVYQVACDIIFCSVTVNICHIVLLRSISEENVLCPRVNCQTRDDGSEEKVVAHRGVFCIAPRETSPTDHPSSLLKATLPVPGVESNFYSCSTRAFQGGDCCTRTNLQHPRSGSPAVISSRDSVLYYK